MDKNQLIEELIAQSMDKLVSEDVFSGFPCSYKEVNAEKLIRLTVLECIRSIEEYRVPVGNSVSGELACEWTMSSLRDLRDEIEEKFGIK